MRTFLTSLTFLLLSFVSGQTIQVNILNKAGGGYHTANMTPTAFQVDNAGNYYIAQYHQDKISALDVYYFELIKFSHSGEIIWKRNLLEDNGNVLPDGFRGAYINAIALDGNNGLYIVGNFGTKADIDFPPYTLYSGTPYPAPDPRSFIGRIDQTDGDLVWLIQDSYNGNTSAASDIKFDDDFLYVSFVQQFEQKIISTNTIEVYRPEGTIGVLKMNKDGDILDEINGRVQSYANDLEVYAFNDPRITSYVEGRQKAYAPKIALNDDHEMAIMCYIADDFIYDDKTVEAWYYPYGYPVANCLAGHINPDLSWNYSHIPFTYSYFSNMYGHETWPHFNLDRDGNILQSFHIGFIGSSEPVIKWEDESMDTIPESLILKLSRSGDLIRHEYIGNDVEFKDIHTKDNGYYYVGTYNDSLSISFYATQYAYGKHDLCLIDLNNAGQINAFYNFGSPMDEFAFYSIIKDSTFYIFGSTEHKLKYNNEFIMDQTDAAFILKVNFSHTSSIDDIKLITKVFSISPNPAGEYFRVESHYQSFTLSIYDAFSRMVLKKDQCKSLEKVDISFLSRGMYLVHFQAPGQAEEIEKLVIAR